MQLARVLGLFLATSICADAAVLHQFTTANYAAPNTNDDGYDPALVVIGKLNGVIAPQNGTELAAGNVGLDRFWNSEWAGFTLSATNGTTLETAEFNTGYFTWTVASSPGQTLNLESLMFGSARGGATETRGFKLFAEVNGGAFAFEDVPLLDVPNENTTALRTAPFARTADLSGLNFQNINSITFRYYPLSPVVGNSMDFNGMTLNGTMIPEPSTACIALIGGIALLSRRKRAA